MSSANAPGYEDLVAAEVLRQERELQAGVSGVLGKPPGTRALTDDEELDLWDWRDPNVNPYELQGQGADWGAISRELHKPRFHMIEQNGQTRIEQAQYAEQMDRRSRARQAKRSEESQPAPPMAAPPVPDQPAVTPLTSSRLATMGQPSTPPMGGGSNDPAY